MTRGAHTLLTNPLLALPYLDDPQLTPNGVLPLQPLLTYWYCVWFQVLNVSHRNCRLECSPPNHGNWKVLSRAMSQLLRPGPVRTLRPIVPNMPGSLLASSCEANGWVTVLGSHHCSVGPYPGSFATVLWIFTGPAVLQRYPLPMPLEKPLTPQLKSVGSPLKKLVMPLTSHPPNAPLTNLLELLLKNGNSYT